MWVRRKQHGFSRGSGTTRSWYLVLQNRHSTGCLSRGQSRRLRTSMEKKTHALACAAKNKLIPPPPCTCFCLSRSSRCCPLPFQGISRLERCAYSYQGVWGVWRGEKMGTDTLTPCSNFSMIAPNVYRSGYPTKKNFTFLKKLGIRSICYLCPEEYALVNQEFYGDNGIQICQFPMEGNKEPFVNIPEQQVNSALSTIMDTSFHPLLIHCNKGKHRTGAVCGCLRKVQGWSLVSIIDEYNRFAGDKGRAMDQQFVELFKPRLSLNRPTLPDWLSLADVNPLYVTEVKGGTISLPASVEEKKPEHEAAASHAGVQFLIEPIMPGATR